MKEDVKTETKEPLAVDLQRGVSNDQLLALMKRMEQGDGEVQWVSCGETVFEALWSLIAAVEGEERLEKAFPQYV